VDRPSKLDRFVAGRGRAVVVVIALLALVALPVSNVFANHVFTDVPTSAFYHDQVSALANAGITGGCGSGKYCPNNVVTRGQMAVFLDRLGNLSNEHGAVVDALTLNGFVVGPGIEQYTLAGGAASECEDTVEPVGLPFGSYALVYTVYGVPATMTTDEVIVSLVDTDDPDGNYQVCFRRVTGNLVAGTYDVYAIGGAIIGQGIFAGGASASQSKVAQFQQSRIGK
jgi:S-layer family protein